MVCKQQYGSQFGIPERILNPTNRSPTHSGSLHGSALVFYVLFCNAKLNRLRMLF
jgi:hypothetical protein